METPLVIVARDAEPNDVIEIKSEPNEEPPAVHLQAIVQHSNQPLQTTIKLNATHPKELSACTTAKNYKRPVVARCTYKISIDGFRRCPRGMQKLGKLRAKGFLLKSGSVTATKNGNKNQFKEVSVHYSNESVYAPIVHRIEASLQADEDHRIESSESDNDDQTKVNAQPVHIQKSKSMQSPAQSKGKGSKKKWFCAVCNKNYSRKYKYSHLKTLVHKERLAKHR